ncbi:unnamed protein product [Allacma fusca]|uniref:BED-type domain-containing protein n=1 Tax=Allacma fusca TaxID=39272 RepID=A0A8J2PKG9_9HEXA|nr:unnamed protein product [Allacma fusca]
MTSEEQPEAVDLTEDEVPCRDHPEASSNTSQRSKIYQHYTSDALKQKFKCNYCTVSMKRDATGSTSNLIRHMKMCHRHIILPGSSNHGNQQTIHKFFEAEQVFSQSEFEDHLIDFIILTNQAFAVCDAKSFVNFATYSRAHAKILCDSTVKAKCDLRVLREKAEIVKQLEVAPGKISLVSDCWTSRNLISFHGIIASWVSKDWTYEEVLLDLDIINGRHTGKTLALSLIRVAEDYGILNKIGAITSDNASNCDTMLTEFANMAKEKEQRVRCLAHIINLACQDSLSVLKSSFPKDVVLEVDSGDENVQQEGVYEFQQDLSVDELTGSEYESENEETPQEMQGKQNRISLYYRIRHCIQKIRRSGPLREKLYNACNLEDLTPRTLLLDCQTRWNSTLRMLKRVLAMRKDYQAVVRSSQSLSTCALTDSEWLLLDELVRFLKPFEDVTLLLSKSRTPTMALSAAIYIDLFRHLESYKPTSQNADMVAAAKAACDKLNKYYKSSDALVYILGLVMDPRCKLTWYKNVGIHAEVRNNKRKLLSKWQTVYKTSAEPAESSNNMDCFDLIAIQMAKSGKENFDELRNYLALPVVDSNIVTDVLKWWKENESTYPALSKMARDVLGVSGTGVPIERAFSFGSDLLKPKALSMSGETIRRRFCLKAWLKYKEETFLTCKMKAIAKRMVGIV